MEKPSDPTEEIVYYESSAAAYVRGKMRQWDEPICCYMSKKQVIQAGKASGIKLHRFKKTMGLPRVRKVLGMLKSIQPRSIVDVGSGRGVFLWPLLDEFPHIQTRAIDIRKHIVEEIQLVADGGIHWLAAIEANIQHKTCFSDGAVDVVTILEVLEHLSRPDLAIRESLRVADRFVIASVPSKEDNNPGHINLFSAKMLESMFLSAGASSVKLDGVLNHIVLLARK